MIKCRKINLQNKEERIYYSRKLQSLEKEFTYPLGHENFSIIHGHQKPNDYFSFFEKLGQPHVLVLELNSDVIGVVVAILRRISGKNTWYCCDFKINKNFRGQKLYTKWMWKFFLSYYMKSQSMFGINMSCPQDNKLHKHTKNIFKFFAVKVKPLYLYEFKGKDLKYLDEYFWMNKSLITNNGLKDIIINDKAVNLYHIVDEDHRKENLKQYQKIDIEHAQENDTVMFLHHEKFWINFAKESVISLIHHRNEKLKISSAEI